jgi:hypothetical protein
VVIARGADLASLEASVWRAEGRLLRPPGVGLATTVWGGAAGEACSDGRGAVPGLPQPSAKASQWAGGRRPASSRRGADLASLEASVWRAEGRLLRPPGVGLATTVWGDAAGEACSDGRQRGSDADFQANFRKCCRFHPGRVTAFFVILSALFESAFRSFVWSREMHVVSVAPDACEGLRRLNWSREEYGTGHGEVIRRWHGASKPEGFAGLEGRRA